MYLIDTYCIDHEEIFSSSFIDCHQNICPENLLFFLFFLFFVLFIINNFSYFGTIEELSKIDKKLAMKLYANGVVYVAVTTLHNGKNEWGWFGVLYGNMTNVPQEREITNELIKKQQDYIKW